MAACRVLDELPPPPADRRGRGFAASESGHPDFDPRKGGGGQTLRLVGARGIDLITKDDGGSETFGYPLYDTHGNMVATLARNGSGYTLGNQQSYDVWGGVRSGSSTEDQGYCANLGHRADPESFLTYMRARYYEPMSGRFVSEDCRMEGANWYTYAANDPINRQDFSGKSALFDKIIVGIVCVLAYFGIEVNIGWLKAVSAVIGAAAMAAYIFCEVLPAMFEVTYPLTTAGLVGAYSMMTAIVAMFAGFVIAIICGAYQMNLLILMMMDEDEDFANRKAGHIFYWADPSDWFPGEQE